MKPAPSSPSSPSDVVAYVGLGSNLGDREGHLGAALDALRTLDGVGGLERSSLYETEPVGPGAQRRYLNAVVRLRTRLAPRALLDALLAIERAQGRRRSGVRNEARTLDLDLLLYGDQQIDEPGLVVPHPRLALRPFVLEPLRELTPALVVPGTGASVATLAARVRDPAAARRYEP
jgi:2-amino-4-hydroxy-6-hydroxymethyldihydropteridine diphosphokinase